MIGAKTNQCYVCRHANALGLRLEGCYPNISDIHTRRCEDLKSMQYFPIATSSLSRYLPRFIHCHSLPKRRNEIRPANKQPVMGNARFFRTASIASRSTSEMHLFPRLVSPQAWQCRVLSAASPSWHFTNGNEIHAPQSCLSLASSANVR